MTITEIPEPIFTLRTAYAILAIALGGFIFASIGVIVTHREPRR